MKKPATRGRPRPTVCVLWGEHFDEVSAILTISTLREAGVRVKVVGVRGAWAKGAHGLGLHADWTLDEALAAVDQVIGVVIPCTITIFQGLLVDPRINDLLVQVLIR